MRVMGGSQLVDFSQLSLYLFFEHVGRVFAWSCDAVQPGSVSLGKCGKC